MNIEIYFKTICTHVFARICVYGIIEDAIAKNIERERDSLHILSNVYVDSNNCMFYRFLRKKKIQEQANIWKFSMNSIVSYAFFALMLTYIGTYVYGTFLNSNFVEQPQTYQ